MAIVRRALSAPAFWIATNAGVEGAVVVNTIATLPVGQGYDAAAGEFTDLIAAGIIDPVKVTRSAVSNAASIAGMVLTTETTVTDIKEPEPADAGGTRPPALTCGSPSCTLRGGVRRSAGHRP